MHFPLKPETKPFYAMTRFGKHWCLGGGEAFQHRYVFLGIECEHCEAPGTSPKPRSASIRAAPKAIAKLKKAAQAVCDNERPSVRMWLRLLGSLMWISGVAEVNIARYYLALKFFRRRGYTSTLEAPLKLWPCAIRNLRDFSANKPRTHRTDIEHRATVFSDASLTGFGGVCVDGGTVAIICGAWPSIGSNHINALEACALISVLSFALDHFPRWSTSPTQLDIFVDNTTLHGVTRRGYSPAFLANEAALAITEILLPVARWRIHWMSTKDMPADPASRVEMPTAFPTTFSTTFETTPHQTQVSAVGNGTGGDA